MTRQLLNTLFVQTPDAYVTLDHDALCVEVEKTRLLKVPLHHLGSVVLFANAMMSPKAMARCVADGREVTYLDYSGRFLCRVVGPTHGNVLLRRVQYEAVRNDSVVCELARRFVAGKLRNSRQVLSRSARDASDPERRGCIAGVAAEFAVAVSRVQLATTLDAIRGVEGEMAARYFSVFGDLLTVETTSFAFTQRTRRPPRDRVNALLSFLYALLTNDCTAALEGVGLDPQMGFLHAMRPGRPALALDMTEEFRAGLADRLTLTLINRRQIRPEHFTIRDDAGDSVLLNEDGRKMVITAYQKRKEEAIPHHFLKEPVPLGLVPHLQARMLARYLRGDVEQYEPFLFS